VVNAAVFDAYIGIYIIYYIYVYDVYNMMWFSAGGAGYAFYGRIL